MLDEALIDLDFISKSDIYKPLLKNYAFNFTIEDILLTQTSPQITLINCIFILFSYNDMSESNYQTTPNIWYISLKFIFNLEGLGV